MSVELPSRFEDGLGYLVHHLLYAFRQGFVRESARLGFRVTPEEMAVLVLLGQEDGLKQTDLSEKLAKDKAAVTRILNKLDRAGLVRRHQDRQDRRVVRAHLTESGRLALQQLFPMLMDYLRHALRGISQQDFDTTCAVLRRLIANLKQEGHPGE